MILRIENQFSKLSIFDFISFWFMMVSDTNEPRGSTGELFRSIYSSFYVLCIASKQRIISIFQTELTSHHTGKSDQKTGMTSFRYHRAMDLSSGTRESDGMKLNGRKISR